MITFVGLSSALYKYLFQTWSENSADAYGANCLR